MCRFTKQQDMTPAMIGTKIAYVLESTNKRTIGITRELSGHTRRAKVDELLRTEQPIVWVANNWNRPDEGFKEVPDEALSTRFGGDGAVVFFGLAKPVRTPLIGPVESW
jgi:hypothetical protein